MTKISELNFGGLSQVGDVIPVLRNTADWKTNFPGVGINDTTGAMLVGWTQGAGPNVNYLNLSNNITGSAPALAALGTDANINLSLSAKGTGMVQALGTAAMIVPHGSTAQRPAGASGELRINTDTGAIEWWNNIGAAWVSGSGGVSSISVTSPITSTGGINPTIGFAANPVLTGNGGVTIPSGTTGQRAGAAGTIRLNSTLGAFEGTVDGATWASIGGGGIPVDQNTGAVTLAPNSIYYIDNGAGLVTLTLPVAPAFNDTYTILGDSAGGWTVAQNALQTIRFEGSASTPGVGGSVASNNRYDQIVIRYMSNHLFIGTILQGLPNVI